MVSHVPFGWLPFFAGVFLSDSLGYSSAFGPRVFFTSELRTSTFGRVQEAALGLWPEKRVSSCQEFLDEVARMEVILRRASGPGLCCFLLLSSFFLGGGAEKFNFRGFRLATWVWPPFFGAPRPGPPFLGSKRKTTVLWGWPKKARPFHLLLRLSVLSIIGASHHCRSLQEKMCFKVPNPSLISICEMNNCYFPLLI